MILLPWWHVLVEAMSWLPSTPVTQRAKRHDEAVGHAGVAQRLAQQLLITEEVSAGVQNLVCSGPAS